MEIVKYLCEFFFTDFWHWLGGLIFLVVIVDGIFVNIFRIIMAAVVRTKKLPERDPMEMPPVAPEGTIWPRDGKHYIFVKGTWIQFDWMIKEKENNLNNKEL